MGVSKFQDCDSKNPQITLVCGGGKKGVEMRIYLITSENCGACKKLKGALQNTGLIDNIEVKVLNPADTDDFNFIKMYQISTFPTLLKLNDNDEEVDRLIGLQPLHRIREFVEV